MKPISETCLIELQRHNFDLLGLYWVIKIIDLKHHIPTITHLLIKAGQAIATDGRRVHVYNLQNNFPTGLYEIIIRQKTHIVLARSTEKHLGFPDWKEAFPSHKDFTEVKTWGDTSVSYSRVIREMDPDSTLNFKYFSDAIENNEFKIYLYKEDKAVAFEAYDKKALIMPMRA